MVIQMLAPKVRVNAGEMIIGARGRIYGVTDA